MCHQCYGPEPTCVCGCARDIEVYGDYRACCHCGHRWYDASLVGAGRLGLGRGGIVHAEA
jgi:hypothetical protein